MGAVVEPVVDRVCSIDDVVNAIAGTAYESGSVSTNNDPAAKVARVVWISRLGGLSGNPQLLSDL